MLISITEKLYTKGARFCWSLIRPLSKDEDRKRREFILNILLIGSIILSLWATATAFIKSILTGAAYQGLSPIFPLGIFCIFCFLYVLSRHGYHILASVILMGLYLLPNTYTIATWSIYLPEPPLIFALVIVMSGILINTAFAFFITVLSSVVILLLTYLHIIGTIQLNLQWVYTLTPSLSDAIMLVVTLGIITIVSWLSNREIERSLRRARNSEKTLQEERDNLENIVEERTRELKQLQLERMFQMYRFVEFGRLASGFFHDMTNPLTTVSLSLEALKAEHSSPYVDQAMLGAKKMGAYVTAVRKQLQQQTVTTTFALDREIDDVLAIMGAKAREEGVIFLYHKQKVTMYGNPLKFSQLITNLVSNAIDAYEKVKRERRVINVTLQKKKNVVRIAIMDNASGIPEALQKSIFEPFVTTKMEKGMGLGLSFCKTIVTKEYHGTITVESTEGKGTTFVVEFPLKKEK